MVLKKIPTNQSIYHNMEYKNRTAYFYFDDRYKKYVQVDGYELILDKNNKPVYNLVITGTYNFDKLQTLATRMKKENFSYEELQNIRKKGIDNYGK